MPEPVTTRLRAIIDFLEDIAAEDGLSHGAFIVLDWLHDLTEDLERGAVCTAVRKPQQPRIAVTDWPTAQRAAWQ